MEESIFEMSDFSPSSLYSSDESDPEGEESRPSVSEVSFETAAEDKPNRRAMRYRKIENNYNQEPWGLLPGRGPRVVHGLVRPERLQFCPECRDRGALVRVQREQFQEWKYYVSCPRLRHCWFIREYNGKAVVNTSVLTESGLPEKLEDYLDIYNHDIDKIVRLIVSEYVHNKFIARADASLILDEDLRNIVACFDGLEGVVESFKKVKLKRDSMVVVDKHLQSLIDDGFYVEGFRPNPKQNKPIERKQKVDKKLINNEVLKVNKKSDDFKGLGEPVKDECKPLIVVDKHLQSLIDDGLYVEGFKLHTAQNRAVVRKLKVDKKLVSHEVRKLNNKGDGIKRLNGAKFNKEVNDEITIEVINRCNKKLNKQKPDEEVSNGEETEIIKQGCHVIEYSMPEPVKEFGNNELMKETEQVDQMDEHIKPKPDKEFNINEEIYITKKGSYIDENNKSKLNEEIDNYVLIEDNLPIRFVKNHYKTKPDEVVSKNGIGENIEKGVRKHNVPKSFEERNNNEVIEEIEQGDQVKEHNMPKLDEDLNNNNLLEVYEPKDDGKDHEETKKNDKQHYNYKYVFDCNEHAEEINKHCEKVIGYQDTEKGQEEKEEELIEEEENLSEDEEELDVDSEELSEQGEQLTIDEEEELTIDEEEELTVDEEEELIDEEEELTIDEEEELTVDEEEELIDEEEELTIDEEEELTIDEEEELTTDEEEELTIDEEEEDIDLINKVKHLAATLVADLPLQYKLKVKSAFSKIGYNFPEEFVNVITSGKVKLRRIFRKIDPEDETKVEVLEKLNKIIKSLKEYFDMVDGIRQRYY